jgi:iron complex outermembrane receptor protein
MEGLTREQIERTVNATDSEDALKYLPSLLVRKRYIGDYNHAILSSRASGTGNSARSAVYGDGILLSNYLGNGVGGLSFPAALEHGHARRDRARRRDVRPVLSGVSRQLGRRGGGFHDRYAKGFEAHAKAGYSSQPFELYNTDATYRAWKPARRSATRAAISRGLLGFSHTDSHGQPLTFATRLVSSANGSGGTPVTGAVLDANNTNSPWYVIGTGTEYRTQQDHFKARLAYDITPTLRADYVLGVCGRTRRRTTPSRPANAAPERLQRPHQHRRAAVRRIDRRRLRGYPGGS